MLQHVMDPILDLFQRGPRHRIGEAKDMVAEAGKACRSIRRDLNQALDVINALRDADETRTSVLKERYSNLLQSIDKAAGASPGAQRLIGDGAEGLSLAVAGGAVELDGRALVAGPQGLDLPKVQSLENRAQFCDEAQTRLAAALKVANDVAARLEDADGVLEEGGAPAIAGGKRRGELAALASKEATLEIAQIVVYALVIALIFRTFLIQPFNIPSGSMKPTLLVGDYIFVSKYSYGYSAKSFPVDLNFIDGRIFKRTPKRGDVIVFKLTADGKTDYIKRLIGLPGDKVQVINGVLTINDHPVSLRRRADYLYTDEQDGRQFAVMRFDETLPGGRVHDVLDITSIGRYDNTPAYYVPDKHYFFMGDNRDASEDSRAPFGGVGMVPEENLVGRAQIIFMSVDGSAKVWQVWKWPFAIRYSRLFHVIR